MICYRFESAGWDEGLSGICAREKRKLTIPSDLAYGDRGNEIVPGGATMVYEVEAISVQPGRRKGGFPQEVQLGNSGVGSLEL